jgi:hypothetical protein
VDLKSRIQRAEKIILDPTEKIEDPHGKQTPFRKKAMDLWQCGRFAELKEHCKKDVQFYELLMSYTRVIDEIVAGRGRSNENKKTKNLA